MTPATTSAPEPPKPAARWVDASLFPTAEVLAQIKEEVRIYAEAGLGKRRTQMQMLGLALRGWELGIPVGQAIEHLYVSEEGTAAMDGELMRAQINRSGVAHIEVSEYADERVTLVGVRHARGGAPECRYTVSVSKADAERWGVWGKAGHWRTHSRNMLFNRATSELSRVMGSDLTAGVSYTPEELGIDENNPARTSPRPSQAPAAPTPAAAPSAAPPAAPPAPVAVGGVQQPTSPVAAVTGAAPPNGGAPSVPLERVLNHEVQVDKAGGGIVIIKTAGITKQQLRRFGELVNGPDGERRKEQAKAYVQQVVGPLPKAGAVHLTEAEAADLIGIMERPLPPVAPPAPTGPTHDDVLQALKERLAQAGAGGEYDNAVKAILRAHNVQGVAALSVDQLSHGVDEVLEFARDPATLGLMLEHLGNEATQ